MTHYTSTTTTFDASQGGQVQVTTKRSRRAGAKWTRSGCLTCKRRRKRCDETKPSCSNCVRLGMACEGYGSMWAKPLNPSAQVFQQSMPPKRQRLSASPCSSGPPAGRTSPCPDFSGYPPSCVPSSSSLNADGKEDRPFDAKTRNLSRTTNDGSDAARIDHLEVVPLKPSSNITHLSHLEAHYLQYHMVQGSKLMVNLESDENPLRSLLIPRACSSPLVMNALCAVSAVHLANRTHNSLDAQTAATNYYIQTMSGLRSILSAASGRGYPEETILAVALLCKYEIVRGSVKQWEMHLDALERLVISRGGFASFDEDMTEFLWGLYEKFPWNPLRSSDES
ncbi:hypothetical protein EYZ11_001231 [Aspergillus tanneri]|uniref:Zn(2)-C6 fungal-type domain-containing protein n=1 Tax=Aspergillus tanneri TaxID=1220188 RepID=A0A4S3JV96_9EURO|nr:hypothetical protein EYZ11_001231 [Aspergillus tanneri]